MKMRQGFTSVAAALAALIPCHPALASGGAGGGGAGSGGSGGGGGGLVSTSITCDNWGDFFNGVLPQGRATFAYSADGSSKSLSVQVSSINVPDGTVMYVETDESWATAAGDAFSVTYYPVAIRQGKGALALSTAAGDDVTFLPPSAGQTDVYLWNGTLQVPLMVAQLGHLN